VKDAYSRPGGCEDQINKCRELSRQFDPTNQGFNESVNAICKDSETFCSTNIRDPYFEAGRNYYDFATFDPDPFPPPFYEGYLNQPHVQAALGVPLNWTQSSSPVSTAFRSIGDYPRPGWLEDLSYLLDNNIKVTLVYGDRDYACNWLGGEAVSLAINHTSSEAFRAAGYEGIQINATYIGGQVRQVGNLSFNRVFESGHEVPAYQPETAYKIFTRALFNKDIATGNINIATNSNYSTKGPSDTLSFRSEDPPQPKGLCYILDASSTCTSEQQDAILAGDVLIHNWILIDANTTDLFPGIEPSSTAGTGTSTPTEKPSSTGTTSNGCARISVSTFALVPALFTLFFL
jgi:hypothetical protein